MLRYLVFWDVHFRNSLKFWRANSSGTRCCKYRVLNTPEHSIQSNHIKLVFRRLGYSRSPGKSWPVIKRWLITRWNRRRAVTIQVHRDQRRLLPNTRVPARARPAIQLALLITMSSQKPTRNHSMPLTFQLKQSLLIRSKKTKKTKPKNV